MFALVFLMVIGTSIWVYFDAKSLGIEKGQPTKNDMGAGGWCACCLLLWIVAFPLYLVTRNKRQSVSDIATRKCPYCAEMIRAEATVCRYCHKDLLPAASARRAI